MIRKDESATIVQELAASANRPEAMVSQMYAEAIAEVKHDAKIMDYLPLFAARRVRERLKDDSSITH